MLGAKNIRHIEAKISTSEKEDRVRTRTEEDNSNFKIQLAWHKMFIFLGRKYNKAPG